MKLDELVLRADARSVDHDDSEWVVEAGDQRLRFLPTVDEARHVVFTTKPAGWIEFVLGGELPQNVALFERYGVFRKSLFDQLRRLLVGTNAREMRFVGDLDPTDIFVFLSLREALHGTGARLRYVGVNDDWLALCERHSLTSGSLPTMDLPLFERALLEDLFTLEDQSWQRDVGSRGVELLRTGKKLEIEGACNPAFYGGELATALRPVLFP